MLWLWSDQTLVFYFFLVLDCKIDVIETIFWHWPWAHCWISLMDHFDKYTYALLKSKLSGWQCQSDVEDTQWDKGDKVVVFDEGFMETNVNVYINHRKTHCLHIRMIQQTVVLSRKHRPRQHYNTLLLHGAYQQQIEEALNECLAEDTNYSNDLHSVRLGKPTYSVAQWVVDELNMLSVPRLCDPDECYQCGRPKAPKRCSRCKTALYCNAICQRADWLNHKGHCKA